ncbi:MAG: DUF58 domain-containing protein [Deltaproteobacteria bacterium]|nr:DUF58 domain-containing protein [Deltaproteobacteria bacterium]MBW2047679.1 DUF58 domain-containing protein [Deltaproteobacteria bacterium]MBW2110256.1 DUF58 domain-containing protein [Deltaproteobacteria bacterium]MBW2352486.1 DUF58 domain-containing protein [Deltaproteobacteria bacterium]HDZ89556.1 DUF58 domain-containing protein [Deltaproteobacteria bacterium]
MLSEELYRKIQRFHFTTKRLASDLFAGQYESAFKGRGMEFAEVREYQLGDDIRTIDWNVSARFGRPFVKVFHEERELTVILILDISGSHLFGTREKFKRELLAEVAGMLAFLAIRTNDKVGAILFSSRVEKYIPPKKGASHVWRLIKEIFTYEPVDLSTNIDGVLTYLNRVARRHTILFLISDCMDTGFEKSLRLTAKKHDLTVIRVTDPAEEALPEVGLVLLRDPETGERVLINSRSRRFRERWRAYTREQEEYLMELFSRAGVDHVELTTDGPVVEPLARLFEMRRRRL